MYKIKGIGEIINRSAKIVLSIEYWVLRCAKFGGCQDDL